MDELNQTNEYAALKKFLTNRFKYAKKSLSFKLYFWFVIVIVGIGASFLTMYESISIDGNIDLKDIALTLIGYSLVLLCSSAIEFIFISLSDDEVEFLNIKNVIQMLGVSSLILGIVLSIISYVIDFNWLRILISLFMTFCVLIMWWITNSKSLSVIKTSPFPELNDTVGDPNLPINGNIPGDFKS